tara:strand:- start:220 stop:630 length:411 start_codon:yes stop_codon:yes gene_type:complete
MRCTLRYALRYALRCVLRYVLLYAVLRCVLRYVLLCAVCVLCAALRCALPCALCAALRCVFVFRCDDDDAALLRSSRMVVCVALRCVALRCAALRCAALRIGCGCVRAWLSCSVSVCFKNPLCAVRQIACYWVLEN